MMKNVNQLLIEFVNISKTNQYFDMANSAMAVLISAAINHEEGLLVELETQDETGEYPSQVYYDILTITDVATENSACIPVALVDSDVMISLMKCIQIVEQRTHDRTFADEPQSKETLKNFLAVIVSPCDIRRHVVENLAITNGDGEEFRDRLHSYWLAEYPEESKERDYAEASEEYLKNLVAV